MSSRFAVKGKGHDATGRTKDARDKPHVRLYEWMMGAAAWQALSAAEVRVYIEIERRYFGKDSNNGQIGLSIRQAAKICRISKETATRALQRLVDLGFIVCVTPGGFIRKTPHATEWRLTRARCDVTGEPATKAFMRWPGDAEKQKPGPKTGTDRSGNKDSRSRNAV